MVPWYCDHAGQCWWRCARDFSTLQCWLCNLQSLVRVGHLVKSTFATPDKEPLEIFTGSASKLAKLL